MSASFQKNPFAYLYESDIQSALWASLRHLIPETLRVPTSGEDSIVIQLIYSEYLKRIDVACLDKDAIVNIDSKTLVPNKGYDTYIYNFPVLLGIELKYISMGSRMGFDVLLRDYQKLTDTSESRGLIRNWIVLGFIQRQGEATPFLTSTMQDYKLERVQSIEEINRIYIVTPRAIFMNQPQ